MVSRSLTPFLPPPSLSGFLIGNKNKKNNKHSIWTIIVVSANNKYTKYFKCGNMPYFFVVYSPLNNKANRN